MHTSTRPPVQRALPLLVAATSLFGCGFDPGDLHFPIGGSSPTETSAPAPDNPRWFLTAERFDGNLGGWEGADARCRDAASDAGVSGTFRALLGRDDGADGNHPFARIPFPTPPRPITFEDLTGTPILHLEPDSTYWRARWLQPDADPDLPTTATNIGVTVDGLPPTGPNDEVWTGTRELMSRSDGGGGTCRNWQASGDSIWAAVASARTGAGYHYPPCAEMHRLICFEIR